MPVPILWLNYKAMVPAKGPQKTNHESESLIKVKFFEQYAFLHNAPLSTGH